MGLSRNLQENIAFFKSFFPIDKSFDFIGREIDIGEKKAYLMFIDGFAKDEIMLRVLEDLQAVKQSDDIRGIKDLINKKIAYIEVSTFLDIEAMTNAVLAGAEILIVDGEEEGIIIDAREYPVRSPEESQVEKVTRGSRDGLVETIVFNTALIRRRIRDPKLMFEIKNVGKRSRTDVAIGYIDDLVDKDLLDTIMRKIDDIEVPSLIMAEKTLEELILKKKWYNPLPQVRFTERPDVVAAHLLEGHVAIIVDTSPSVMLLPSTIFYFSQYAEDYYQNPLVGTFTRFMRFLAILTALFLTPCWLLLAENVEKLPQFLSFIGAKEEAAFGLLIQFLLLELGIEFLKISSLHTPQNLGASFGIIGGLIVGELAIKVGVFSVETIFYTAVTAIATFCIPNVEFASAIRVFRLLLLIFAGLLGKWGFFAAIIIICLISYNTSTLDKKRRYTWPLVPFSGKALINVLFRRPIIDVKRDKQ